MHTSIFAFIAREDSEHEMRLFLRRRVSAPLLLNRNHFVIRYIHAYLCTPRRWICAETFKSYSTSVFDAFRSSDHVPIWCFDYMVLLLIWCCDNTHLVNMYVALTMWCFVDMMFWQLMLWIMLRMMLWKTLWMMLWKTLWMMLCMMLLQYDA
jgi:hypothetical protein